MRKASGTAAQNSKRKQILDAAIRLFARQGYHATSIQEIVDELGIAKGSVYFYFKSKDDLLVSIFQDYDEQLMNGMAELPGEEEFSPRERLRLQVERQLAFFARNGDFFMMLFNEPFTGEHHEYLRNYAVRFRSRYLSWLYRHVQSIYGDEYARYWVDGALLLGGIMSSYMESAAQNRDEADVARISGFLVRRLDDVMRGMAASGETPIVTADRLRRMIACGGMAEDEQGRVRTLMDQLLEQVRGTEAEEAAALLNAECGKAVPHRVVARALLVLLEKQAQPEWRELLSRLESALEEEFGCAMRKD